MSSRVSKDPMIFAQVNADADAYKFCDWLLAKEGPAQFYLAGITYKMIADVDKRIFAKGVEAFVDLNLG